jgi:hypothetical protein
MDTLERVLAIRQAKDYKRTRKRLRKLLFQLNRKRRGVSPKAKGL